MVVGKPVDFWKRRMPRGMFLRSGADCHLDPLDAFTFEAFLETKRLTARDLGPIPRDHSRGTVHE